MDTVCNVLRSTTEFRFHQNVSDFKSQTSLFSPEVSIKIFSYLYPDTRNLSWLSFIKMLLKEQIVWYTSLFNQLMR